SGGVRRRAPARSRRPRRAAEGLDLLNHVLEQQANTHGAEFVDTTSATAKHHLCAAEPWIEGLESTTGAAPLHPTAAGERAMADAVLAALGQR
ncbi:GDSL-like Lipase/Acylhydrolase, partial [Saccharomonospora azurea SZMC 14600]